MLLDRLVYMITSPLCRSLSIMQLTYVVKFCFPKSSLENTLLSVIHDFKACSCQICLSCLVPGHEKNLTAQCLSKFDGCQGSGKACSILQSRVRVYPGQMAVLNCYQAARCDRGVPVTSKDGKGPT